MKKMVTRILEDAQEEHDTEVVSYGLQTLLDGLLSVALLVALGVCFHKMSETILYLVFSYLVARSTGGYHAQNRWGCMMITLVMYFGACFLPEWMDAYISGGIICGCVLSCFVLLWFLAPVEHPDKPLSPEILVHNQMTSRIYVTITFLLILFMIEEHRSICLSLLINLMELSLSVLMGRVCYRFRRQLR